MGAWMKAEPTYLDGRGVSGGELPEWMHRVGAHQALACPLVNKGEKIGVVCFVSTDGAGEFSEETEGLADDFSEVSARILGNTQFYSQAERRSMRFGSLVIEPTRETVRWQDTSLCLSKTEYDVLYVLAEKQGSAVSQETLIREVWGRDYVPQGKVVDVTIHRLRRKLAALPEGRKLIRTVRG